MKRSFIYALVVMTILALGAVAAYADQCYPRANAPGVCGNCPAPAYDRTPIPVTTESAPAGPGGGPVVEYVDPWVECGAFCYAGQIPTGWPYGWEAEYWLRPDSNF